MTYSIELSSRARKDLGKLPEKIKEKVVSALRALEQDPYLGKKLTGEFAGLYSIRIWPYRIIYEIVSKQKIVPVFRIGHRQGVYK